MDKGWRWDEDQHQRKLLKDGLLALEWSWIITIWKGIEMNGNQVLLEWAIDPMQLTGDE